MQLLAAVVGGPGTADGLAAGIERERGSSPEPGKEPRLNAPASDG